MKKRHLGRCSRMASVYGAFGGDSGSSGIPILSCGAHWTWLWRNGQVAGPDSGPILATDESGVWQETDQLHGWPGYD